MKKERDCISRQEVLEYIEGCGAELGHSSENELVCRDIKEFPSVVPQLIIDILDKIRSDIDDLDTLKFSSGERIYKDEVLDIIDKYKADSIERRIEQ